MRRFIKFIDNKNCLIKKNNGFAYKNLNLLVKELINKKGELMQKFAIENKEADSAAKSIFDRANTCIFKFLPNNMF